MELIDRATITEEVAATFAEQLVKAKLGVDTDPRLTVFCCALIKAEVVSISAIEEIYCNRISASAAKHMIHRIEHALTQLASFAPESYHDTL